MNRILASTWTTVGAVIRRSWPLANAEKAHPVFTTRPLIGVLAVLLGSIISTLDSRITNFGLADVRGAVHAGFDEGAWITTAFTVGQMLIGPVSVWLGAVLGPRRVLMFACTVFAFSNFLLPFSSDLRSILVFQFISGVASGTFIPLTIGFVARNLPPQLIAYGISAYAMSLELSLNFAASIEGWFSDHWSWKWIFWDTAMLAPIMLACIFFGMPRQPVNRDLLRTADWHGIVYASLGFSLIYVALDQGNRLDWLNSGLISSLLVAGSLLLAAFVVHESVHDRPWIHLGFIGRHNFPLILLSITFLRFSLLSTSFVIPLYLTTVQNYRAMEVGGVLLWIVLPQFLLAPVVATVLRYIDPRWLIAPGFALIGCACFMASGLTREWAGGNFLPSEILQAGGQSLALTAMVFFSMKHLEPAEIFTFGALLQTARLLGGELGAAFVQTFVRVREQVYSNLIGLHVTASSLLTDQRLANYAGDVASRSTGQVGANARATALLSGTVQAQAYVLAIADTFMVIGLGTIVALLLTLLFRAPPVATNASRGETISSGGSR